MQREHASRTRTSNNKSPHGIVLKDLPAAARNRLTSGTSFEDITKRSRYSSTYVLSSGGWSSPLLLGVVYLIVSIESRRMMPPAPKKWVDCIDMLVQNEVVGICSSRKRLF
ncbi:hypothetical protein [Bradyrhizobium sp. 33ap4]|uniref:hypothetical protein n=1 Tax=Bradyrhizobium sp. 33ap4 TaxID=3061630 RepID=UPI00292E0E28|nr:hypothetical protein [Bradyrhizobium sp. 33ap4]